MRCVAAQIEKKSGNVEARGQKLFSRRVDGRAPPQRQRIRTCGVACPRTMLHPAALLVIAVTQPSPLHKPLPTVPTSVDNALSNGSGGMAEHVAAAPPLNVWPCRALEDEIVRVLSRVRGRGDGMSPGDGMRASEAVPNDQDDDARMQSSTRPRDTWLAQWHVPSPKDWVSARRVAATALAKGCVPVSLSSQIHSLRLFLSPCLTQCEASSRALRCYCRACNSTAARPAFELVASECTLASSSPPLRAASPLRLYIGGMCDRLQALRSRLLSSVDDGESAQTGGVATSTSQQVAGAVVLSERDCAHVPSDYSTAPSALPSPLPELAKLEEAKEAVLASNATDCRTMFGEACCPLAMPLPPAPGAPNDAHETQHQLQPCGGPSRGVCVPIEAYLAHHRRGGQERRQLSPQPGSAPSSCQAEWPRRYAAARCLCRPHFAGSSCDGCAPGWQGVSMPECPERGVACWPTASQPPSPLPPRPSLLRQPCKATCQPSLCAQMVGVVGVCR